jgi:hypothetical protein
MALSKLEPSPRGDTRELSSSTRQAARGLLKHAARVSPGERVEWAQAMINELDYLSPDMSAIGWAFGCLSVCYSERIRAMVRPFESPPRLVLVLEMIAALCLLAAWTFAAYSAQILTFGQTHLSDWWREYVLIAVLPILAVLHVVFINSHRRGSPVTA